MNSMQHVTKKVKLKLAGLDGNAYFLVATFINTARKQGTPPEEIDAVIKDCASSNYNHLLCVLMANTK